MSNTDQARLLIKCADQPGLVAAVSALLAKHGANIVESDQYSTDPEGGMFFLRTVFHLKNLASRLPGLQGEFEAEVARKFDMDWTLSIAAEPKRIAIMVSRQGHCLLDLLWRVDRGELPAEIGVVVSNHTDFAENVEGFGLEFRHIPVTKDTKEQAEREQLDLLAGEYDLIVMARYMQILTANFLDNVECPVINIHHSFLPAFAGASPYKRAKDRGVKLIGATAHYATEDLDEGPIIEQDVVRVTHRESAEELARRGADVERMVLSRAIAWHCEDRVLRHKNTTVVFR